MRPWAKYPSLATLALTCLAAAPNPLLADLPAAPDLVIDPKAPSRLLNGVAFAHGWDGSVALGHGITTDQYRGFLRGHCYALFLNLTSTDFAMYDPGAIRQFTAQDEKQVTQSLTQILDSFRALPESEATHERLPPH